MLEYFAICFVCSIATLSLTFIDPPSKNNSIFTRISYTVFMIPLIPLFLVFFFIMKVIRND